MSEKNISIKVLCERLWTIEKNSEILNYNINGVIFWQLIRFQVFEEISQKLGIYEQAHTKKDSFSDKLKVLPNLVLNSLLKSPMKSNYTKNILIFDHPRKIEVDKKFIDIYTDFFINELSKEEYEVIESPYLRKHFTKEVGTNRKYTDAIILNVFLKRIFYNNSLSKEDLNKLVELEQSITSSFNIRIELVTRTIKAIKSFKLQFNYYDVLIKKRNPSKIYLVISYGREALIAAAKANKVEVIEFQHGVITPFHFAYSFPHLNHSIKYFPDKIFTFGEYWNNVVDFPKGTKIEVYGFPYLNQQLERYKEKSKKKKQVIFISQGTIGKELSLLAKKVAESLPEYDFIYKLHPGEYSRWKNEYPALITALNFKNFEVIDHNKKNLYSYLAESEFQVGVYSTAIFEGLTLQCKTILYNLPGIEYMTHLIDEKIAKVVNSDKETINFLNSYNTKKFDKSYFFYGVD